MAFAHQDQLRRHLVDKTERSTNKNETPSAGAVVLWALRSLAPAEELENARRQAHVSYQPPYPTNRRAARSTSMQRENLNRLGRHLSWLEPREVDNPHAQRGTWT